MTDLLTLLSRRRFLTIAEASAGQELSKSGTPFNVAYTLPQVKQDIWIRYWLAGVGVTPSKDLDVIGVSVAQTIPSM